MYQFLHKESSSRVDQTADKSASTSGSEVQSENNSLIKSDAKMDVHQGKSDDFVREQEQVLSKNSLRESDAKMDHYQEMSEDVVPEQEQESSTGSASAISNCSNTNF